jgi:hypothetical protein
MAVDLPSPQLPVPVRLDYYLRAADTWAQILSAPEFSDIRTVFDICCGWSVKIELALARTQFRGDVYCIDKSVAALAEHKRFMTLLPDRMSVHYRKLNILQKHSVAETDIPAPDLIIGNHCLDDLLLTAYCSEHALDGLALYREPEHLHETWTRILTDEKLIGSVLEKFSRFLMFTSEKNTIIALSQYPGYQDKLYGISETETLSDSCLKKLETLLMNTGIFGNIHNSVSQALSSMENPYFKSEDVLILKTRC